jgi:hypothetical protein
VRREKRTIRTLCVIDVIKARNEWLGGVVAVKPRLDALVSVSSIGEHPHKFLVAPRTTYGLRASDYVQLSEQPSRRHELSNIFMSPKRTGGPVNSCSWPVGHKGREGESQQGLR